MPAGRDTGHGHEPRIIRHAGPKDAALLAARAAGLSVLEGRYSVAKYHGDVVDPAALYEVVESAPNMFLTAGINEVLLLAAGQTATAYNGTNTRLAVGDSTTAPAPGQTNLQAATNTYRQVVDSPPVVAQNQITWVATFGTTVANFDWREVGVVNAATDGEMWSRTVIDLGSKSSSATWVLNWTLAIS